MATDSRICRDEFNRPYVNSMLITAGPSEGIGHCCRCGAVQPSFELAIHERYCENIRLEQGWTNCQICTSRELLSQDSEE